MINIKQIKALREKTGISIAECRQALEAADGNEAKALEHLQVVGKNKAEKKSGRSLGASAIAAYIHSNGLLGTLVELCSETDFVAKNEEFRVLAEDLAMQIAATAPETVAELLEQPYIKGPEQTIKDLIESKVQKFGERIEIARFARFDGQGG